MGRLTFAHEPNIRLGAIALIIGVEDTRNTCGWHLVRILLDFVASTKVESLELEGSGK